MLRIEGSEPRKSTAFDWPPGTAYQINSSNPVHHQHESHLQSVSLISKSPPTSCTRLYKYNPCQPSWDIDISQQDSPPWARQLEETGGFWGRGWGGKVGNLCGDLDIRGRTEGADSAVTPSLCLPPAPQHLWVREEDGECDARDEKQSNFWHTQRCCHTVIIDWTAGTAFWVTSTARRIPSSYPPTLLFLLTLFSATPLSLLWFFSSSRHGLPP